HLFKMSMALIALSLLLSACGPSPSASIARSDLQRVMEPDAPPDDVQALVDNNNSFAFDLYRSLRAQDGNLIYSPYSISLALAMTYAGARGETESQMVEVLHFLSQDQLHPAFNALDLQLAERSQAQSDEQTPLQLNIANAVWAEQTYPFLQSFLDTIALNYGAGVRLADFINQYEAARSEINDWVSDQTEGKIEDLIPEGVLTTDTRMALVNAIYFKGDWLRPFDADSTQDASFRLLDGSEVTVPMMNQDAFIPYIKGDGWQAIELAYEGETAAMDIIVPDEGRFEEVESSLDGDAVSMILGSLQPTSVTLALPKFEFESEFSLADQLKALGMTDAFDPDRANFSGMSERNDLFISEVVHKAFVAVDEKGTEAAAATAVIVGVTSAPAFEVTLTIDRPFIFLIRDIPTGQILFVGRVLNPGQ
ncbi:MAG TPA: serpin family protein, partial [Anaerolineales bacterium]|nr:serpin family protein [Anaerolineales bacterium]